MGLFLDGTSFPVEINNILYEFYLIYLALKTGLRYESILSVEYLCCLKITVKNIKMTLTIGVFFPVT